MTILAGIWQQFEHRLFVWLLTYYLKLQKVCRQDPMVCHDDSSWYLATI